MKPIRMLRFAIWFATLCLLVGTGLADNPCPICGNRIKGGQYYIEDFWKNQYHARHARMFRRCYSCERLIHPQLTGTHPHPAGGEHLSDGRSVCNICIKSHALVHYPVQAQAIMEEVLADARKLGVNIPSIFEVKLVDDQQMARFRQQQLRPGERNPALTSLRLSKRILRGKTQIETRCEIYILSGLHELQFRQSLAHELMHVWMFVNCQYNPSPALTEGSCNYLSYRLLQLQNDSDYRRFYLQSMNENPDAIYGDGFRRVKQLVTEFGGMETFIQYLTYNDDFPTSKR